MNEIYYEQQLEQLGQLRDRLLRLEETDYMTAYYKGYSSSGDTLEEIKEQIRILQQEIETLEEQMDEINW